MIWRLHHFYTHPYDRGLLSSLEHVVHLKITLSRQMPSGVRSRREKGTEPQTSNLDHARRGSKCGAFMIEKWSGEAGLNLQRELSRGLFSWRDLVMVHCYRCFRSRSGTHLDGSAMECNEWLFGVSLFILLALVCVLWLHCIAVTCRAISEPRPWLTRKEWEVVLLWEGKHQTMELAGGGRDWE